MKTRFTAGCAAVVVAMAMVVPKPAAAGQCEWATAGKILTGVFAFGALQSLFCPYPACSQVTVVAPPCQYYYVPACPPPVVYSVRPMLAPPYYVQPLPAPVMMAPPVCIQQPVVMQPMPCMAPSPIIVYQVNGNLPSTAMRPACRSGAGLRPSGSRSGGVRVFGKKQGV